ncbi:MAG: type II toxin-antitoxin system PrlF family antitoxin [Alphaproteobacteria bacterium]|nr:type II toxin-antitoxin system PrlF family antitoxin [Alphaproteobacteria bacterium]
MALATLTSKGQTTIPKSVREKLALKAGDRLEFLVQDDGAVLMIAATVSLDDLEGMLSPPPRPVTLEEMDRAIRNRAIRKRSAAKPGPGRA